MSQSPKRWKLQILWLASTGSSQTYWFDNRHEAYAKMVGCEPGSYGNLMVHINYPDRPVERLTVMQTKRRGRWLKHEFWGKSVMSHAVNQ